MFIRATACSSPTSMIPLDPTLTVPSTPPTLQLWGQQLVVSRALQCGGKAPARLDCVGIGRCAPEMDLLVTYWSERGKRIWWWEEEGHQKCSPTMEHQMRKEISRIWRCWSRIRNTSTSRWGEVMMGQKDSRRRRRSRCWRKGGYGC